MQGGGEEGGGERARPARRPGACESAHGGGGCRRHATPRTPRPAAAGRRGGCRRRAAATQPGRRRRRPPAPLHVGRRRRAAPTPPPPPQLQSPAQQKREGPRIVPAGRGACSTGGVAATPVLGRPPTYGAGGGAPACLPLLRVVCAAAPRWGGPSSPPVSSLAPSACSRLPVKHPPPPFLDPPSPPLPSQSQQPLTPHRPTRTGCAACCVYVKNWAAGRAWRLCAKPANRPPPLRTSIRTTTHQATVRDGKYAMRDPVLPCLTAPPANAPTGTAGERLTTAIPWYFVTRLAPLSCVFPPPPRDQPCWVAREGRIRRLRRPYTLGETNA